MANIVVYLPIAVSIDTETGEMIDAPQVDFMGNPWMYTDTEQNIWQPDREDTGEYSWGRDKVREDMANDSVTKMFENHWSGRMKGMYQVCENCYESEFVEGTVIDLGDGSYDLEIREGFKAWLECPTCGMVLDGDTEDAMLSWSINEPTALDVRNHRDDKRWP